MSDTAVATEVETANELIVVKALVPAVVFAPGGVEALVDKLERDVRAEITKLDISTPKGRDEIRSLAFKVARSKTAIDDMGKNLVAEWKEKANLVDADRRLLRDRLDNLKIEARKPLTEWEDAEKTRVMAHENALTSLQEFMAFPTPEPDSATVVARLQALADLPPRDWQEFSKRATDATAVARTRLEALLASAVKREADAAELARLRAEEEARQQKERDERIAAEAAEKARKEAEEKAETEAKAAREKAEAAAKAAREKAEQEAKEAREKAEADQRRAEEEAAAERRRAEAAEVERLAAVERAEKAEREKEQDRIAGHKRALASINGMVADACSPMNSSELIQHIESLFKGMEELQRDFQEFKPQADEAIAAGRKKIKDHLQSVLASENARRAKAEKEQADAAERERKDAADKAERERLQAVENERQRVAAIAEQEKRDAEVREKNKTHSAKINREVLAALVLCGVTEEVGKLIISAIVRGTVPHTSIAY